MSFTLSTDDRLTGGGSISDAALGVSQFAGFGAGILPAIRTRYTYGTGANQVNAWYLAKRTLAATTYDDIDLTAGCVTLGTTFAFTKLKRVFVGIVGADGTKKLRVGPQGRTHANALWFQAATANFWEETYSWVLKDRPVTGWSVTASSTDVLSIYNPGASSLDYAIWLLGIA
jgi:hypothetical protein